MWQFSWKQLRKTVLLHSVNNETENSLVFSLFQSYFGSYARNGWKYLLFRWPTFLLLCLVKLMRMFLACFSKEKGNPDSSICIQKCLWENWQFWHVSKEDSYAFMLESPFNTKLQFKKGHQLVYRLQHWLSVAHMQHHKLNLFSARSLFTNGDIQS